MSKLKRHATFSTGTRPKLSSLASAAAAAGSGGGAMRKAASVDFANVPEIMTTPTPSPSVGRRTPGKWHCVSQWDDKGILLDHSHESNCNPGFVIS